MAIGAADLILYGALSRPEDDVALVGGGIDIDNRPVFTQLAANDTLEALSSAAGDTTQLVTVTGRDAAGAVFSDSKTLTGTTPVAFTGTFERVQKALMDSDAVGVITIRRASAGPTVGTIPIGERGFFAHFLNSASEAAPTLRFEKDHWRNSHATLTLNVAKIQLFADPSSVIRQGVEVAKNGTTTATNRKTAPSGVTFVDDGVDQNIPGTTLEAASAIGLWWELSLAADNVPIRDTFTARITGTSV